MKTREQQEESEKQYLVRYLRSKVFEIVQHYEPEAVSNPIEVQKVMFEIVDCLVNRNQERDRIARERGIAKGKNRVIEELRLRDMPNEDGTYPVYTAIEMSRYLARENGDVNALTTPNDKDV